MNPPSDTEYQYKIGLTYDGKVPIEFRKQLDYTGISYLSWYLRKGSVELKTADETLRASPGEWVFMDPLTTRSHCFSKDAELISIRFRLDWRGLNFIPPRRAPKHYVGERDQELLRSAEALAAFESTTHCGVETKPSTHCLRNLHFTDWLYHWHLTREAMGGVNPIPMDPRVSEIMSLIGQTPGISSVNYSQLSAAVGLSKAQINRIFKASTGLTPRQWSEVHSMSAAEEWLQREQLSIKEIAHKLNFFDASHFIKWFRKHAGCTPKSWRAHKRRI